MNIKNHIPNIITLGNVFCGTLATIYALQQDFVMTAWLVIIGILFDFFDGFAARILKVQGELGKQLDSLADMITSGVVPGIVMLQLLKNVFDGDAVGYFGENIEVFTSSYFPYLGLLLTLFAAYRLAKFNIDERQTDEFIGLPTPAMSLFVISLPLIAQFSEFSFFSGLVYNKIFLLITTVLLSIIMISELRLFSLKFKNFSLKKNLVKYIFLILSLVLLIVLKFVAIPLIILLYILISLTQNILYK